MPPKIPKPATPEAQLLLRVAERDWTAAHILAQHAAPISTIGFHVQQYVEKVMKAVLVSHAVIFRRTHDLDELAALLMQNGITLPAPTDELTCLSPFAVTLRYNDMELGSRPRQLQAHEAIALMERSRVWVKEQLYEPNDD